MCPAHPRPSSAAPQLPRMRLAPIVSPPPPHRPRRGTDSLVTEAELTSLHSGIGAGLPPREPSEQGSTTHPTPLRQALPKRDVAGAPLLSSVLARLSGTHFWHIYPRRRCLTARLWARERLISAGLGAGCSSSPDTLQNRQHNGQVQPHPLGPGGRLLAPQHDVVSETLACELRPHTL